jgi:uncharacterized membrane protein YeiB
MPAVDPLPAPPRADRLVAFDLARCIAIIGMVIVDVVLNACIDRAAHRWEGVGPRSLELLTAVWNGRASALFVMLAGAGLVLITAARGAAPDPQRAAQVRRTVLRRGLFLFVVGHALQASTFWYASILQFYAFFLGFGVFLVGSSRRLLWTLVLALPVAFLCLYASFNYEWDLDRVHALSRAASIREREFWTIGGQLSNYFFNGTYPFFPWFAFVLIGIWVARQPLRDPRVRRRILARSLLVLAGSVAVSLLASRWIEDPELERLFSLYRSPPMPLYVISAAAQSVALIALSFEVAARWSGRGWLEPLLATGRMSFTVYLAHIFVGGGWRPGLLDLLHLPPAMAPGFARGWVRVLLLVPLLIWACHWWRRRVGAGPMEALLRRVAR